AFVFFFFQAEDGIRDFHVTGVQTCALPISWPARRGRVRRRRASRWARTVRHGRAGQGPDKARPRQDPPAEQRPGPGSPDGWSGEIGRASWRERVRITGVGVGGKRTK